MGTKRGIMGAWSTRMPQHFAALAVDDPQPHPSFFTPEPATVTAPSTPTHTRSTQAPHQPSARVLPEEGRRTQEQRPQRHHDAPDEGKSRGFDRRRVLRPRPHLDSAPGERANLGWQPPNGDG